MRSLIDFVVHPGGRHPSIQFRVDWHPGLQQARMVASILSEHVGLKITKERTLLPGEEHISLRGSGMEVEVFNLQDGFDLHIMKTDDPTGHLSAVIKALEASGTFRML